MSAGHLSSGLTYLELLVTIAVAALLLSLGLPSFEMVRASNRLGVELNYLVRAVHVANNEVAKGGLTTVICPSNDGQRCSLQREDWQIGWLLFTNRGADHPPQIDPGDTVLAARRIAPELLIEVNRDAFIFRDYRRRSTNGTVIACTRSNSVSARALVISYTGRPRIADARSDGSAYRCQR